jgi:hypothetical protein
MREMIYPYKDLARKPQGERPLRRPRRRWKHNIEMGIKEKI